MRGRSLIFPEFQFCVGLCSHALWILQPAHTSGSRELSILHSSLLYMSCLDFWLPDLLLLILSIGPGQGSGAWEGDLLIDAFESKNGPWRRSKADLGDTVDYQKV